MAIKEKPRDLEFTYEDEDNNPVYNIKFMEGTKNVSIDSISSAAYIIPAKVLAEIVDFLRDNNVIEGGVPKKPTSFAESLLPLPVIETKDGSISSVPVENVTPIASFDISKSSSSSPPPLQHTESAQPETIKVGTGPGPVIINNGAEPTGIPNRAVIRTRVKTVDDPLAAEREAAEQRQENPEKTVKRY